MVSSKLDVAHVWLLGGFIVLVTIVALVSGLVLAVSLVAVSLFPPVVTQIAVAGLVAYRAICWIGEWVEGL